MLKVEGSGGKVKRQREEGMGAGPVHCRSGRSQSSWIQEGGCWGRARLPEAACLELTRCLSAAGGAWRSWGSWGWGCARQQASSLPPGAEQAVKSGTLTWEPCQELVGASAPPRHSESGAGRDFWICVTHSPSSC